MTPLVEILLLIVMAVFVLLVVSWAFGAFNKETLKKEALEEQEEHVEPVLVEYEPPKTPEKEKAVQPVKKRITGKAVPYEKTNMCFKAKGAWFEVLQSEQGAMFIITENGTRRYLNENEKKLLKKDTEVM